MAGSSDANSVPKGTTLSWACTTDGLGGLSSHLVTPKLPVSKTSNQTVGISNSAELGRNQALLKLDSDITENMSTPTRIHKPAESDTSSKSKNSQFSETLEKYVAYLKSIKRPKIVNSKLLDGIDRASRSIEGCIKLAPSRT